MSYDEHADGTDPGADRVHLLVRRYPAAPASGNPRGKK